MSDTPLASLSLTHVHYNPRDPLSYASAWLALLPQGLCIVYSVLLFSGREIEVALAFGGQLACEALNWGLKRLIKEQRPDKIRVLGKGYGMPSSHAQFVGFWSVYVSLWLWIRFKPRRKVDKGMLDPMRLMMDGATGWKRDGQKTSDENTSPSVEKSKKREKEKEKDKDRDRDREKDRDKDKDRDRDRDKDGEKKQKRRKSDEVEPPSSPTTPGGFERDVPPTPKPSKESKEPKEPREPKEPDASRSTAAPSPASMPPVSPAFALQLHHPHLTKLFLSLVLLSSAFLVCVSRVYLSYHTFRQVYIGYTVGAGFASVWFLVTEIARRLGYIDVLLEHPLLRLYRVRDLCCEEDLVELGWSIWEEKRKRRRKMLKKSVRFAGLPGDEDDGKKGKKDGDDSKKRKKKS